MKKGKTTKLSGYRTFKAQYGTIDAQNLKSIYINIQTWLEPKNDVENWSRVVLNMSRSVKHCVLENINKEIFDTKFIVDLDLRTSGLQLNKKSFMNLEINFFLKDNVELTFKDTEIKDFLKNLTTKIFQDNLKNNQHFKFYLSKTNKPINKTVKTENI
jgi:hypothetical protein